MQLLVSDNENIKNVIINLSLLEVGNDRWGRVRKFAFHEKHSLHSKCLEKMFNSDEIKCGALGKFRIHHCVLVIYLICTNSCLFLF